MTKQQIIILVILACAVFCVLCSGGYMVISSERAYEQAIALPTSTPRLTSTPLPTPTVSGVPMGQWRFVAYNITRQTLGGGWDEVEFDLALINHTSETMGCDYCLAEQFHPEVLTSEGYNYEAEGQQEGGGVALPGLTAPIGHWKSRIATTATGLYFYVHRPKTVPIWWLDDNPGFPFEAYPIEVPLWKTDVVFPTDLSPEYFLSVDQIKVRQFTDGNGSVFQLKEIWAEGNCLWMTWVHTNASGYNRNAFGFAVALANGAKFFGIENMITTERKDWWELQEPRPVIALTAAGPGQSVEFTVGVEGYERPSFLALTFNQQAGSGSYGDVTYVDIGSY